MNFPELRLFHVRLSAAFGNFRERSSLFTILVGVVFASVFLARFLSVNNQPAPPSEDLGGDLIVLHTYTEANPVFPWFHYAAPPLYYLFVVLPTTSLLPTLLGLKVIDSLIPSILVFPFYFLSREVVRNRTAALLGAFLFSFSDPFNNMMGWGGTLNMFALFFATISLFYAVRVVRGWSPRNAVLTAFFMSLTVGTHQLTALFTGLAITLLFVSSYLTRSELAPSAIQYAKVLGLAVVFSLPYAVTYLPLAGSSVNLFVRGGSSPAILAPPISVQFILSQFSPLAATTETYVTLIALTSFGVASLLWRRDLVGLVIVGSSALGAVLLMPLLNPTIYVRAAYFLTIPLFLLIAAFHRELFVFARRQEIARKVGIFLLLALVILGFTYAVFIQMQGAISYNQYLNRDSLRALDWINSHTQPNDTIYTNYNGLGAWIAGYSQRPELSPRPIGSIVTSPDYERTLASNHIDAGNYALNGGAITIGDFFPAAGGNPIVLLNDYAGSEGLFLFNDANQILTFNATGASQQTLHNSTLASAEQKTFLGYSAQNGLQYQYNWASASGSRTVTVDSMKSFHIHYLFNAINSSQTGLTVNLQILPEVQVRYFSTLANQSRISANLADGIETDFRADIQTQPGSNTTTSFNQNPPNRSATLTIQSSDKSSMVDLTIAITLENVAITLPIEFSSSAQIISSYNVRYLLLDTSFADQLDRFLRGTVPVEQAFQDPSVIILKVLA